MGLGDLFKRFSKGSSEEEKKAAAAAKGKAKGGRGMPPLPKFLKKDRFIRPDAEAPMPVLGAESDMADAGSFKRPGKWLKARLGGATDSQAINNIEKTKVALKKSGGLNDQEIQNFLDDILEDNSAEPANSPPPLAKGP